MRDIKSDTDTKNKIFLVAAHLFAEKGYNGVSMREISEQSGVSKPMIYYYFENKEGIYKQLLETGLNHGGEIIKQALNKEISFRDKLKIIMQKRLTLTQIYPDFSRFFLLLNTSSTKLPLTKEFEEKIETHRNLFKKLIQEGIDSGEFGPGVDPSLAIDIIGAVLIHYVRKYLNNDDMKSPEEISDEVIELLFRGLNE